MNKKVLAIIGVSVPATIVAFLLVQAAWSHPAPPPAPQVQRDSAREDDGAVIKWSPAKISQTLFPGTSSTTVVHFKSSKNLSNVVVDVTQDSDQDGEHESSSTESQLLKILIGASPASFASIIADQDYQITLTLRAPPTFRKRSFGGTVHVRNAGRPLKTYATPLPVRLQIDFASSSVLGLTVSFPATWVLTKANPLSPTTFYLRDQNEESPGDGITINVLSGPLSSLLPDPNPQLQLLSQSLIAVANNQWRVFIHRELGSGMDFRL